MPERGEEAKEIDFNESALAQFMVDSARQSIAKSIMRYAGTENLEFYQGDDSIVLYRD